RERPNQPTPAVGASSRPPRPFQRVPNASSYRSAERKLRLSSRSRSPRRRAIMECSSRSPRAPRSTLRRSTAGSSRSSTTAPSIGLHVTLDGDVRGLPLRFARIGAAVKVAFVVFVVAPEGVAPSAPFSALTLKDIDRSLVRSLGYAGAVQQAVAGHESLAFILE